MLQQQNNLLPNLCKEKLIKVNKIHTYNTRNFQYLSATFFKLDISNNSIIDQGVKIWNNLPSELKIITSINKFKT